MNQEEQLEKLKEQSSDKYLDLRGDIDVCNNHIARMKAVIALIEELRPKETCPLCEQHFVEWNKRSEKIQSEIKGIELEREPIIDATEVIGEWNDLTEPCEDYKVPINKLILLGKKVLKIDAKKNNELKKLGLEIKELKNSFCAFVENDLEKKKAKGGLNK